MKTMSAMKTLLLLTALLNLLACANSRRTCTVEEMEGLQIVGYAYTRVFRFTNYTGHQIELYEELHKSLKQSEVSAGDVGELVHLHQGFDRKLILVGFGFHDTDDGEYGGTDLFDKLIYASEIDLAVLDDASVDSQVVVKTVPSGYHSQCAPEARTHVASFVYDNRVYFKGGYTDIRREGSNIFLFVSNSSDLCSDLKFPVIDIAVDPPTCHNRLLNETADDEAGDDEWIVALVDGIRTTRSKTLCRQEQEVHIPNSIPTKTGELYFPNHDVYCYYLKKPGMKTSCLFASGDKYLFTDVQLEPANPVRMAKKISSTTRSPITTQSSPEAPSGQTSGEDEPEPSGTTTSCLLCGLYFFCFLWIL